MRITIVGGFFLPVPPVLGGATEKVWHRLAGDFAAKGHQVTYLSRSWPGLPAAGSAAGVVHRRLRGAEHTGSLGVNLLRDFFWGIRVVRALPPADVVICHSLTLPVWLRWIKPSAGRIAVVLGRSPRGRLRFYRGVDRVYATSSELAARIRSESSTLGERTRIIWNPIDWKLHAAASAQSGDPVVIGYVGRLHPEKGLESLLAATARLANRPDLPNWRLEIVGPAEVRAGGGGEPWRDDLAARFAPQLGSRMNFRPAEFDPERLASIYGAMDVFCYPSLAENGETFGVAVAEAMAARAAPVVSALACFGDLVHDGETGLVFDHRATDAEARLAGQLARLVSNASLRRAIATRAREHVRRFDYPEIAALILNDLGKLTCAL